MRIRTQRPAPQRLLIYLMPAAPSLRCGCFCSPQRLLAVCLCPRLPAPRPSYVVLPDSSSEDVFLIMRSSKILISPLLPTWFCSRSLAWLVSRPAGRPDPTEAPRHHSAQEKYHAQPLPPRPPGQPVRWPLHNSAQWLMGFRACH